MSESKMPWLATALVTVVVAALGSPVVPRILDALDGKGSAPAAEVGTASALVASGDAPAAADAPAGESTSTAREPLPVPPSASERYLHADDLAGLTAWELEILRNEVYARHGRRFARPDLQAHFDRQSWYRPRYSPREFSESILTPIERRNVAFIAALQKRRR